jgi:2-oxoglutarate ferredoxin oxidoreductase subunit gamma
MLERLLVAGSGGQGIILIGRIFASVAVRNTPYVTFFPAYGAEVRGGTSNCHVVLSTEEIASPLSEELDSMMVMNQASVDKYLPLMTKKCFVLANSSMCKVPARIKAVSVPATDLANQLGNTRTANFIMLGAYLARKRLVSPEDIERGIAAAFSAKDKALIEINTKAFRIGLES